MAGEPVMCEISLTTEDDLAVVSQIRAQLIEGMKLWKNLSRVVESATVCRNFQMANLFKQLSFIKLFHVMQHLNQFEIQRTETETWI